MGLTPRQARRLRVGLRREGPAVLVHGDRERPAPIQLPAALRTQIVAVARGRYPGLLCQLDGSPCAWFGASQPLCSLLAAIDDATGAALAGTFRAQEDAAGYLPLLHTLGCAVGIPAAVYTDGHGIFMRHKPYWTPAEEFQAVQQPPQVGRALQTLGIHHIVPTIAEVAQAM